MTTERVPWADGKNRSCNPYRLYLAGWAKRMSWTEVSEACRTSWGVVCRAAQWVVAHGLAHRSLDGVVAIGVDEIAVWKGQKYLTVVCASRDSPTRSVARSLNLFSAVERLGVPTEHLSDNRLLGLPRLPGRQV